MNNNNVLFPLSLPISFVRLCRSASDVQTFKKFTCTVTLLNIIIFSLRPIVWCVHYHHDNAVGHRIYSSAEITDSVVLHVDVLYIIYVCYYIRTKHVYNKTREQRGLLYGVYI